MRLLRALPALCVLSLVACGETPEREDAGVPDAGVPDAGVPDAGVPDAGEPDAGPQPEVCDAGTAPMGVPQLTGEFFVTDGGVAPFTPNGDSFVGTWGAVHANVYLPRSTLTAFIDPSKSYIDGGTQWISVREDGGYAQALDVNLALWVSVGVGGVTYVPFATQGYGAAQVTPDGGLTLLPTCGEAPLAARFARPSEDGGTQLLLRVALDAGTGAQNADIVFDLVPLAQ